MSLGVVLFASVLYRSLKAYLATEEETLNEIRVTEAHLERLRKKLVKEEEIELAECSLDTKQSQEH